MLAGACALVVIIPASAQARASWPLRVHSSGAAVRTVQANLSAIGIPTSADGAFGPATRKSVKRYERREGLVVNGRVSHGNFRRLKRDAGASTSDYVDKETPGSEARLSADGRHALIPADAPQAVKDAIIAANRIVDEPYKYGGGHGVWEDSGYDCSGTVSYALHGAGLLGRSRDSTGFMSWARKGRGDWITVFANSGHAFAVIAGLRLDTSGAGEDGPRWRPEPRGGGRYVKRHPSGL
jgi:cell wall-associated NlpC family hydrolase